MDARVYWIWLQHAFGPGSEKPWRIFNRYDGGIPEFHEGGARLWNSLQLVTEKEARMLHSFSLAEAEAILEVSEKLKHRVLTPESEKYPDALRHIFDPPAVLYCRGVLPDVDRTPAVAVVGSRKATEQTLNAALTISYQLALSGAVVVSGGALGGDAAAHKGAMRGMGKTIAVLPCGLSNGYLVQNHSLRERIVENGALITEYALNTGVTKGSFQVRNRLMSGLCCATLVMGAKEKSGTLITAKHAKEQDRDVFVHGEDLLDPACQGSLALARDGAKAVRNAEELLGEFRHRFGERRLGTPHTPVKRNTDQESVMAAAGKVLSEPAEGPEVLSADSAKVLAALAQGERHITELIAGTGLPSHQVLSALTELELLGQVQSRSGRRYRMVT